MSLKFFHILVAPTLLCLLDTGLCEEENPHAQATSPVTLSSPASADAAISPTIRPIVSPNALCMEDRLKLANSLNDVLAQEEISALLAFVKSPVAPAEVDVPGVHGLKNDILNILRRQRVPPSGFSDALIEIFRDTRQDPVMRDYAIQHLVSWHAQGAADAVDTRQRIREVLYSAANENSSIAGTALLGMHRLSKIDSSFAAESIDQLALSHALSPTMNRASRISAIQVCSERGIKAVLPAIESLPHNASSLPLRLSAAAAVGRLGTEENRKKLGFAEGDNEDFAAALRLLRGKQVEKQTVY